ncbi:MAG: hypothetical protein HY796_13135 [Elusimicrobia bacterium]|nr:hypothetical protein [Elusimicrobiota bacterium]
MKSKIAIIFLSAILSVTLSDFGFAFNVLLSIDFKRRALEPWSYPVCVYNFCNSFYRYDYADTKGVRWTFKEGNAYRLPDINSAALASPDIFQAG